MENQLKSCPICGNCPVLFVSEKLMTSLEFDKNYPNNGHNLFMQGLKYSVESCCVSMKKWYDTEEEATEKWNTRK